MIYFRRLQNWTMQEQYIVCLYGHMDENSKMKSLAKINWSTVSSEQHHEKTCFLAYAYNTGGDKLGIFTGLMTSMLCATSKL